MPPIFIFLLLAVVLSVAAQAQPGQPVVRDEVVRVRLLERKTPRSATVEAVGGPVQVRVGGALLGTLQPGEAATVETARGDVSVRFLGTTETVPKVRFVPHRGAHFRLRAGSVDRTYHGALGVTADGSGARDPLRLINSVRLEDYVSSVVASEYPFREIEGVKAQAVLARTYALRSKGKYGPYDVVDHVSSQVYRGISTETATSRRAAEATRGEVLTYRGNLIEAVYSSSSGGHTADNDAVWNGRPLPYLRGRQDPFDHASPDHEWTTSVNRDRLLRTLSTRYGMTVTGIEIGERSREGRARSIRLLGSRPRSVPANDFRITINGTFGSRLLRSAFFSARREGDRYVFQGRGFGHGVGMSQYGAREQARQGYGYRDILAFYFAETRITQRDEAGTPLYAEAPPQGRRTMPLDPIPVRPASTSEPARPTSPIRTGW